MGDACPACPAKCKLQVCDDLQHSPTAGGSALRYIGRSALFVALGMVAILSSTQLANFVAVASAFSSLPLSYIYPAMLHFRLMRGSPATKALDITIMLVGVCCTAYIGFQSLDALLYSDAVSYKPICR